MKTFYALIDRYTAADDCQRDAIEAEIWQRYGVVRAVLVLDMSSFTASVHRDGILPYLSRIWQMHAVTAPIVAAYSGEVVKYQADNLLAVFPDATQALWVALSMRTQLLDGALPQRVGIGLSYGRILLVPGLDSHGDATNLAFKLGEDIASNGEILVTADFVKALDASNKFHLDRRIINITDIQLEAFCIVGDSNGPGH